MQVWKKSGKQSNFDKIHTYTVVLKFWSVSKPLEFLLEMQISGSSPQKILIHWLWGGAWAFSILSKFPKWLLCLSKDHTLKKIELQHVQISSVTQSCLTLCDPMNRHTGLPVHHQLQEFTQTHVHRVSDAIQPSHPLSSPSPPAPNPSRHQSLFQWDNSSHEVAKVLEFQL